MERDLIPQTQPERGETAKETARGASPRPLTGAPSHLATGTPVPPRLTPNPALAPPTPASSSSPPPPLTPAPCFPASLAPKTTSPPALIPSPPKLTPTPNLAPAAASLAPSATSAPAPVSLIPTPPSLIPSSSSSSSSSSAPVTSLPPSSETHGNMTSPTSPKTSSVLTNGKTRPAPTPASTPIMPFHAPGSGKQVSQPHPLGTPGPVQTNQSASPVSRVSQQPLLLGRGLKGSGHDQVLLRAQMLILTSTMRPVPSSSSSSFSSSSSSSSSRPASTQLHNLTLRPTPPGTLTIPPTLRLKPPSAAPPPLSRPRTPIFPPLRPRPQPSAAATESQTTPTRHLSVPPPTLYSSVRSIPLRPRLHFPNGHRSTPPRQSPALRPIAAATARHAPPMNRPWTGHAHCPSTQSPLGPGQSQHSSVSMSHPLNSTSCFERSPSAARQLQIIALSSGRQSQPANSAHAHASVQSQPPAPESPSPRVDGEPQRTSSADDARPRPPKPSAPETSPAPPSLAALARPPSPRRQTSPPTPAQQRREGGAEEESQREEEKTKEETEEEKETSGAKRRREEAEKTEGVEAGQVDGGGVGAGSEAMDVDRTPSETEAGSPRRDRPEKPEPDLNPGLVPDRDPDLSAQNQTPSDPPKKPQSTDREDLCENMSTQSDNQSALSSLSSQSPPSSPLIVLPPDNPPPLLPAPSSHPTTLSLSQARSEAFSLSPAESETFGESEAGPWAQKVWPEGRQQVLTHLVEGFVIQEGLQPFPVNRSSLLVREEASSAAPESNGVTNGTECDPPTDAPGQSNHSSDSDGEGGATDDALTLGSGPREKRAVLHCQFCGKRGHAHNFMRSKRFCSTSCARGYNVGLTKRLRALSAGSRAEGRGSGLKRAVSVPGKPLLLRLPRDLWSAHRHDREEEEEEEEAAEEEAEVDPAVPATTRLRRRAGRRRARRASAPAMTSDPSTTSHLRPAQWSVEQVCDFIHTLPGCREVSEAFRLQEIDGQALLLLTEDHLMTSMNIKLGPALKICAHINALKHH